MSNRAATWFLILLVCHHSKNPWFSKGFKIFPKCPKVVVKIWLLQWHIINLEIEWLMAFQEYFVVFVFFLSKWWSNINFSSKILILLVKSTRNRGWICVFYGVSFLILSKGVISSYNTLHSCLCLHKILHSCLAVSFFKNSPRRSIWGKVLNQY